MADQESEIEKIKGQLNSMELRLRRLESALPIRVSETKSSMRNKPRSRTESGIQMISERKKRDWNHR